MKTKNLFTSLAAAVMLSAGLAGAGVSAAEPVHAATTQTSSKKVPLVLSVDQYQLQLIMLILSFTL